MPTQFYEDIPPQEEKDTPNPGTKIPGEPEPDADHEDRGPVAPAVEEAARSEGWVSLDEWVEQGKDAAAWRDADVFLERGTYFRTMSEQRKKIDKLEKMVGIMTTMQKNIRADERKKVMESLRESKIQALENNDFRQVAQIDDAIKQQEELDQVEEQLYDGMAADTADALKGTPDARLEALAQQFKKDNAWYFTDPAKRAYADMVANSYKAIHPDATPEDVINYVAREVPKMFNKQTPANDSDGEDNEEADTPRRNVRRSPVGTSAAISGNPSKRGKKRSVRDLDPIYQEMYARFKKAGAVANEAEYLDQLDLGGEGAHYE